MWFLNGFKKFSKISFKSALWLCFYLIVQTISAVILFLININTDNHFLSRFLELFAPIYGDNTGYSIEKNFQVLNCFNELMDNFLNEVLLISGIIIISCAFIVFKTKNNPKVNSKSFQLSSKQLLLLLLGGISFNILISAGIYFLPDILKVNYDGAINNISMSNFWIINLVSAGIVTPIVEEIIFRYGILGCFIDINPVLAIFYQAILFATVHGNPIQMIYTFILGVTFGYLTYKTKSILPSILLHISLNSSTIIVSNMFNNYAFFGLFYCLVVICISFYIANHFVKDRGKI